MSFSAGCAQQQRAVRSAESSISGDGNIENVKVVADNVKVRAGCSNDTAVLQTSNKNTVLQVLNKVSDWYAVKLPNNKIGFVPSQQCKPIVVENQKSSATPQPPQSSPGTTAQTGQRSTPGAQPMAQNPEPQIPDNTQANNNALTSQEQEMLRLVNEARSQNGQPPLTADIELTKVARVKSQDMIDNNYFSHNSPTYGSPFDMMKQFGIKYVKAGENIAGNQDVQKAHDALMNSPGHRKNILSPDYTHIGIGIKSGGTYDNMFTQMFISKPK